MWLAEMRVSEAGGALTQCAGNERKPAHRGVRDGDVGGPWVETRAGGVSALSLLTFFAAAKKVSAAPHRGNASKPETHRGRHPKGKTENQAWRLRRRQKNRLPPQRIPKKMPRVPR